VFVAGESFRHDRPIRWLTDISMPLFNALRQSCCRASTKVLGQLQAHPWVVAAFVAGLALTGIIEWRMGRSMLGPDGKFGLWEGNIWSSENSQRLADPYSFSHLGHGMMFYALLWLAARKIPVRHRFLMAVLIEAGWEILENSPFIIDRYRQVTISLGYVGDSVLNSLSDILMMSAGFLFTWKARPWVTVAVFVAMEVGCALWVRDNLTLNIIMLLYPVEAIKAWQMAGQPPP
jgi:hypothetical protein